jgi:3-(3-hydroxy-phenyl)propionate hydroxylase
VRDHEPCVVVGAGPVGLTAALALRRQGLRVLVLEADPIDRVRPGSRAIGFFFPTLRRWEKVLPGLGQAIARSGIQMMGVDTWYGDKQVFKVRFKPAPPMRWGRALSQKTVEQHLYDAAVDHGVEFRWSAPVATVKTRSDGVLIGLESGEEINASYVIGADGAKSVVRKAIGVSMHGHTDPTPFIIVDVDEHPDGSTPHAPGFFQYNSPQLDGRNVMRMPFAGGMRIDLQCKPTDDVEHLASPEGLKEWIPRVVDPWHAEHIQWVSTYRFHQVVAESYTDAQRRVLLAGEAAHLFAPWGARGLNSGVFDATDAATAIAQALRTNDKVKARKVIERCATDRHRWGVRNCAVSTRGLRIMRAEDRNMRVMRDLAAKLAPAVFPAGAWLANGPMQLTLPRPGSPKSNMYY